MKEHAVEIISGTETLEARLLDNQHDVGVVICHPHPLFGGSMDNKVVTTVARATNSLNVNYLRFNFRGVGKSSGVHDDGKGEQLDVLAAIEFAQQQGWKKIILAGFSFGAGMACLTLNRLSDTQLSLVAGAILIAPAVHHFDAPNTLPQSVATSILMGDADEVVPFDSVNQWQQQLDPRPEWVVFDDASHFFHRRLVDLKEVVIKQISPHLD